jgi:hypothetical protein
VLPYPERMEGSLATPELRHVWYRRAKSERKYGEDDTSYYREACIRPHLQAGKTFNIDDFKPHVDEELDDGLKTLHDLRNEETMRCLIAKMPTEIRQMLEICP